MIAENTASILVDESHASIKISGIAPLEEAGGEDISYLTSTRYIKALQKTRAKACFIPENLIEKTPSHIIPLKTMQPHLAYAKTLSLFYPKARTPKGTLNQNGIHKSANIDISAKLESNITIEAGAIIGANAQIGAGTIICAYAVIGANCAIGREGYIGAHASISNALIGDRVFIHTGARIGQDGFGYVPQIIGAVRVPQVGRVIIQNDVEIGANTTIDRGSSRDTVIGEHSKIDNLVQIGHNTQIGRHCFIIAQTGISGSVRIDDYVILLGQVGVSDGAHIETGARIGGQSGVIGKIPAGKNYMGYPARDFRQFFQETALLAKMWKANKKNRRGNNDK